MPATPTLDALLAAYPPERVRQHPTPGTATKADLEHFLAHTDRLAELIDGVIVEKTMGFREGYLGLRIGRLLGNFVAAHDLGVMAGSDGTIEVEPDQVRAPDVAFYPWDQFPGRRIPTEAFPDLTPDLAVEVLSPSNTKKEMSRKRAEYFAAGGRLVWEIDPRARTVAVYTSPANPTTLTITDTLTGDPVLPGFAVAVADLLGPA